MDKQTGLERESLVIKGVRSELRLEAGRITIVKEATTQARPTQVEFAVTTVRGSTIEAPRRGGRGWFHVATTNGSPAPVGELAASGDPYTLPITKGAVGNCRKLHKLIEKHVKERGMPADVGPNQGRFTSGVVVSGGPRKAVSAPMVTMPDAAPELAPLGGAPADDADAEASADEPVVHVDPPDGPRKKAVKQATKKAVRKRTTPARDKADVSSEKVELTGDDAEAAKPRKKAAKKTTKKATKKAAKKAGARKAPAESAAVGGSELVAQLRELGELHAAGVLDDDEFAAAKKKLLA